MILGLLLASPPLFGLIFDLTGSYSGIFYTFGGLAMLVTLVVPYVRMHARDVETTEEPPVSAGAPSGKISAQASRVRHPRIFGLEEAPAVTYPVAITKQDAHAYVHASL